MTRQLPRTSMQPVDRPGCVLPPPPPTFPLRHNTVIAGVLQSLLVGQKLRGFDAVFNASTTRLAAYIHALTRDYGWPIERHEVSVGSTDGRAAEISEYFISREMRFWANANGAVLFCPDVRAARAKRRDRAALAQREAAQRNKARRRSVDPQQASLAW